jgi:hypothetical protein
MSDRSRLPELYRLMSVADQAELAYSVLGDHELTIHELAVLHPPGVFPQRANRMAQKLHNEDLVRTAVERLRREQRVDRKRERGHNPAKPQTLCWVYFRVPKPLTGDIAALNAIVPPTSVPE